MKTLLLATASYLAFAGIATAADLAVKAAPMVSVSRWTGCYVGIHGAVVRHKDTFDDFVDSGITGSITGTMQKTVGGGGGQIGCNWQDQNLVYGIEGDGTWAHTHYVLFPQGDASDHNYQGGADWFATLRGRVGITAGTNGLTLIYLTGGLAFGGVKDGVVRTDGAPGSAFVRKTLVGWTAGFGAERMLTPNWTIKAEALYVDLGAHTANFVDGALSGTYNIRRSHEFLVGKVGLNYKF
jgi:outer membrane immunogenic protein